MWDVMTEDIYNIKKIITLDEHANNIKEFEHLFEVQLPPIEGPMFSIRSNYEIGTLLVGDLVLNLEIEQVLEFHPFPEWVVQLRSQKEGKAKAYLIVPNISNKVVKKISRKPIDVKINLLETELNDISIDELIAFEYDVGINVKVPAFIPHFFISSKIDKENGETPPYLQVFEPKLDALTKYLKVKTTYFHSLPYKVRI